MTLKEYDTKLLHANNKIPNRFEELYTGLRKLEKRIYTDEEVAQLPQINKDHVYKEEWKIREASSRKLVHYLATKKRPLKILEAGCGNGWLSHQLSKIQHSAITGMDVNLLELSQAKRVFASRPNLNFIYGDLNTVPYRFEKFDVIVFAASIQYFRSFSKIIETALSLLNINGEIHITDSNFYSALDLEAAGQRSKNYFQSNGFEAMNEFYFHHSMEALKEFEHIILYDPTSIINKILRKRDPFYWVCIKK